MDISRQILSDIVIHNKYAKYLPDLKRRESWQEIVNRNAAMHIRKYPQLTNEIESIYRDFVLSKRVLPSMRSLQFGGPAIEINNARIFNCFGEETKFITSEGLRCFRDFKHGDEIIVKTHNNNWKKAVVKNYGKQKLNTLTFKKGKSKKTVRVTENHRWILKDGTETCDIKIGDGLFKVNWFDVFNYEDSTIEEKIMWAYGYVYGDGSLIKNKNGVYQHSMVRLCGHKIKYFDRFTELGFKNSSPKSIGSDIMIYTGTYLKTLPNIIEEPNYLIRAFVRGYLDADGDTTRYNLDRQEGTSLFKGIQITKDSETINYIIDLLSVSGFFITGIDDYTGQETNYGVRPNTKRIRGFTSFGDSPNSLWYLREIEKNYNEEDVWCLEVEDDHSFILDGGLVTGNCSYVAIDDYRAFSEACFLLLSGCGVGYSVQKHHVKKLPVIKQPIKTKKFLVEDSIMGWADAVKALCKSYFFGDKAPIFDFRDIRPKGSLLVTSGGKAPGPEPLRDMLHNIKKIFERKQVGDQLDPIECHDIVCFIAQAVLAGGVRRSATISLFNMDDQDMLSCKHGAWWELNSQRALANNSAVLVRHKITESDFMSVWDKTRDSGSGEPGIFLTHDKQLGTNPSLRRGTKVLTDTGIFNIEDLEGKKFNVKNLNGDWSPAECFLSGKHKKLIKITLQNKFEYFSTKDHKWPVNGIKVKTKNLKIGDELPINKNSKLFDGDLGDYDDGFLYGWVLGDGWFIEKTYNGQPQIGLIVSKKDYKVGIGKKLEKIIQDKTNCKSVFKKRIRINNNGKKSQWYEINTQSKSLINYLSKFGLPNKKQSLSKIIFEKSTEEFRKGLIDGLFSSDGSFSIKDHSLVFVAKHKNFINSIGELLGFYGLRFSLSEKNQKSSFPNLKDYGKTYQSFRLKISDINSINHFFALFKIEKYNNLIINVKSKYINRSLLNTYKIIKLEYTNLREDVWDISVYDDTHCFQLSHCITGNCGEVSLHSMQFCNLTEINGSAIRTQEDFNNAAIAAAFIGTLQAGYTDFHYLRDDWKEVTDKEALLGVGITGLANKDLLGLDFKQAADLVLKTNANTAKKIGINKAARTTLVKPSGTSSIVLGTSSGIHAWFAPYYIRRIRLNKDEAIYKYLKKQFPDLLEDEFHKPDTVAVLSVPQKAPDNAIYRSESPIDLLERVKKIKQDWISPGHRKGSNHHNVSVTVSIKDDEWDTVGKWMWTNRDVYNGVSVLPYDGGTYKQAPFEEITESDYHRLFNLLKQIDLTKVKETQDETNLQGEAACAGGACEII